MQFWLLPCIIRREYNRKTPRGTWTFGVLSVTSIWIKYVTCWKKMPCSYDDSCLIIYIIACKEERANAKTSILKKYINDGMLIEDLVKWCRWRQALNYKTAILCSYDHSCLIHILLGVKMKGKMYKSSIIYDLLPCLQLE